MLENVGALLRAVGLDYGDVVKATVYLRDFGEFAAMNARLPRVLPDRAADPGDGRRDRPRRGLPRRDRGHRRPLRSGRRRPAAARSTATGGRRTRRCATIGWPLGADDLDRERVRARPSSSDRLKTAARASKVARWRSTVLTSTPSIETRALPRVGPTGPYQVTLRAGERQGRGRAAALVA